MHSTPKTDSPLLEVSGLTTKFTTHDGEVTAVNDVSFSLGTGECVGIVGESGSGKSQLFMSMMGLLAKNGEASGSVKFNGQEILNLPTSQLNRIRGGDISMIFQDPMTSLNPYMRVVDQLVEVLIAHKDISKEVAKQTAFDALELVRIPEAAKRMQQYPHELSGGMRQRVLIAMALLCSPKLLIADEPTTALDVTIQAQVLALIDDLRKRLDMAVAIVTHDLGVVAGLCDQIMVVYAGRVVEAGSVEQIFSNPQHPYTQGLLQSIPTLEGDVNKELSTVEGTPPSPLQKIVGCPFAPRCPYVMDICKTVRPNLEDCGPNRLKACHLEAL